MRKPVSSRPARRKISVRSSPVHGRGVFAQRAIESGEVICEYKGRQMAWDEAIQRTPHDPSQPNHTFYFDLGNGQVIDGAMGGNSARWINHSCAPNCEAEDHGGRIYIRALCEIAAGGEIGIDYALIVEGRYTPQLLRAYVCLCAASNCRGTMLAVRRKRPPSPTSHPKSRGLATDVAGASPMIRVLERPHDDTLIVSWKEPGRCCYNEQRWQRHRAPAAGICALRESAFEIGAMVFRPVAGDQSLNQDARIAESSLLPDINLSPDL